MNKPEDILKFVEAWKSTKGIADNMMLTDDQITEFVGNLQKEVADMDYTVNKGTTVIGYSGGLNGTREGAKCGMEIIYPLMTLYQQN